MKSVTSIGMMKLPPALLKKIDQLRGDIPRTRFIVRTLEKALKVEPHEYRTGGYRDHKDNQK